MINSPPKQLSKKLDSVIQKLEFSSLKKELNFNFSTPSLHLLQSSNKKFFFDQENFNNNDINVNKNIKQKLEDEFDNIKQRKETFPIVCTVNDKFLDLLINIYSNTDNINIDEYNKNNLISELDNNNSEIINNIPSIKKNSDVNVNANINEQITCICLKSNCNNNYCSCHKNKNFCNENCRCINCKNKYGIKDNYIIQKCNKEKKDSVKNICRCKNTKCSSLYCDCKKNSLHCSEKCQCVNCENI